jgi:hypothetical protein
MVTVMSSSKYELSITTTNIAAERANFVFVSMLVLYLSSINKQGIYYALEICKRSNIYA